MKRVLFIDGSNLYAGQYELFGPNYFLNGDKFIKKIENSLGIKLDRIYVYASFSSISKRPTKKQKQHLKNEGLFFKSLRLNKKVIFFKGYRSPTSGKEKEVDVKLAVDIVDMTYRNMFDELYFLSGDADFMHALNIARNHNKPITVLALHNRIPFRFVHHFNTIIFGKDKNIKRHSLMKRSKKLKCIDLDYNSLLSKC